ncbi:MULTISPECIES: GAF and ANTAR domain-containing protein [unclassified Streptomyces]|uniref:GAF and ANTAR domain-containing protein n=1 Tax=unclassified Streptomyces TaxID=2593676 RepID=UPI00136AE030|nr:MULTISPECIES: GAF and ANTAR domain-containing protein [unclassified Streptomyces]NEA05408.1 ANTAR domain-containing protein [Streptomyces sp. SID10116]MYY87165.1 ANTAR domain-containing protein [Streptomyces sp. SID335]MYZ18763.1 ANTAR domain-containing protein [Streptomyces sp. SID337]NDZ87550.1 ANTAR domain-containing protein [Streptomyces sp. SID10115]NEB47704.1 ANTAR domain-containing protein [Streptomyces sp. SID339]
MMPQQQLADVFVALAGSATEGSPDVSETLAILADRSPALLQVRAASVVYTPGGREKARANGSDPDVTRLEHEALSWQEGPGHGPHRTDARLTAPLPLDDTPLRRHWPRYVPRALALGHTHVVALPLVVPDRTLGALVLFSDRGNVPSADARALGQSLADFTAVTLHRAQEAEQGRTLTGQLERALTSRVVIEQAKGVLATRRSLTMDDAFDALRSHARSQRRPLNDVAREVVDGQADPALTDPTGAAPEGRDSGT